MLFNCSVGEESWESLGLQGDPTSQSKANQSWIFIGKTDAEAEIPILWTTDAKNWLIGKDPDAGKDWKKEEKGMTEDEMVWWHHWLDGHEFQQTPEIGDGQGSLECCRNVDILGIRELQWTGMGEFNSDDCYIYYCGQESFRRNGVAIIVNKSPKCSTWMQSQKRQNDLCSFPRQTIQYHSNPSLCPNQ